MQNQLHLCVSLDQDASWRIQVASAFAKIPRLIALASQCPQTSLKMGSHQQANTIDRGGLEHSTAFTPTEAGGNIALLLDVAPDHSFQSLVLALVFAGSDWTLRNAASPSPHRARRRINTPLGRLAFQKPNFCAALRPRVSVQEC